MIDLVPEMPMRIRPSSLALTVACNASLQLQESVPPLPETDDEAEGHAGHWVARRYAAGYGHELPVGQTFQFNGRVWEVDVDMYTGAQLYTRALGGVHPNLIIEKFMRIPRVHATECGGTPDARRFFPDAREAYGDECPAGLPPREYAEGRVQLLRVGDYKYGHRYVEVFENFQLVPYVSGFMDELELTEMSPSIYVELILCQPRSYHRDGPIRIWRVHALQLRNTLIAANDAAERALIPLTDPFAPHAKTGPHCLDCRARHVCRTLQLNTGSIVDFAHTAERVDLDAGSLGQELVIVQDAKKRLEARETGLLAQGEALVRAGHAVPFYSLKPGQSRLTYFDNVSVGELIGLADLTGVDIRKPQTLKESIVTPTQAIQLGIDEAVMNAYAHRPPGKLRLERDNAITARKVFSK